RRVGGRVSDQEFSEEELMSPDNVTKASPEQAEALPEIVVVEGGESGGEGLPGEVSPETVLEQAVETEAEAAVVEEAAADEAANDILVAAAAAEVEAEASAVAEAAEEAAAEDLIVAEVAREVQAEAEAERELAEEAGDVEGAADAAAAEAEAGALATAAEEAAIENLVVAEAAEEAAEEAAIVSEVAEEAAEEAAEVAVAAEEVQVLAEATADVAADEAVEEAIEAAEAETEAEAEAEAGAETEAEAEAEDSTPAILRGPGEWYVVHTYAGYENKVKANLHSRIGSMQMEEKIFDVVIPMEDVMEIKGGKKQVVQKKVFPGYLLVRMVYDNDSWYVVRNTPGVTGFVSSGTGTKPTPLSPREVEKILAVKKETAEKPQYRLEFDVDDVVRIISGPFADFTGTISEINVEQSKLKVMVNIFDRETPVELAFDQVAKA
ncbi:MAG TPA: transcription termination/antitermination protein NusG, partial [Actinomycetota bacterium]|nr:transcription termination/antitermination protein NusG [Actinomycetota bacterium]